MLFYYLPDDHKITVGILSTVVVFVDTKLNITFTSISLCLMERIMKYHLISVIILNITQKTFLVKYIEVHIFLSTLSFIIHLLYMYIYQIF